MQHPDPKRHQQISFIKSGIRILGFALLTLPSHSMVWAAVALIFAELVSVVEELV